LVHTGDEIPIHRFDVDDVRDVAAVLTIGFLLAGPVHGKKTVDVPI